MGTGLFVFFGWLSDRIGRKKIMMAGCLLGAITYFPIYKAMTHFANPALEQFAANTKISLDRQQLPGAPLPEPEDGLQRVRQDAGLPVEAQPLVRHDRRATGAPRPITHINDVTIVGFDEAKLSAALKTLGYPATAKAEDINVPMLILLVFIQLVYVTMVYGPIAAFLVELFPARIRYTSMSLPYHIGNGWFGGMLPLTAAALVAAKGDIFAGLWYPVIVAAITLVIGLVFIRESREHRINTL